VIYQSFALYLRRRPTYCDSLPSSYWRMAILFYGVSAAGNLAIVPRVSGVVSDPTGTQSKVSAIVGASALISIFGMGAFALLAWLRVAARTAEAGDRRRGQNHQSGRVWNR